MVDVGTIQAVHDAHGTIFGDQVLMNRRRPHARSGGRHVVPVTAAKSYGVLFSDRTLEQALPRTGATAQGHRGLQNGGAAAGGQPKEKANGDHAFEATRAPEKTLVGTGGMGLAERDDTLIQAAW